LNPTLPPSHHLPQALTKRQALAAPTLAAALVILLSGCGGTTTQSAPAPTPTPLPPSGIAISGQVLAGRKPLAGATVQLYAAGATGNGSTPTQLSSAATDTTGAFTIAASYTCPAASSQLYLAARNGALASAGSNSAITLITPLGRCNSLPASTKFIVNEVTTAASAWALSQFFAPGANPGPNLGATATNTVGLANAVAIALSLAGNTTGTSPGPTYPATGTFPAPRINALANLLNTCIASAPACTQLFSLTTAHTSPANTLDAALNLVRNPGANVTALFNLSQTSTAFAPTLLSAPPDWTLPLTFTGGGLNEPGPIAVDSKGNLWVASYPGVASQFSPLGVPPFPSGITGFGLSESYGLAIDPSDNVWITDENSPSTINAAFGAVTVLNPSGQPLSGPNGFSTGGLNFPVATAIDPNGAAWVVDYGNSHLTLFNPSGQPTSGTSGYFSDLFAFPVAIALDASHSAWIANMGGNSITRVSPDGRQFTNVACCNAPSGLALDPAGNIWVANYLGDSVSQVSPTGAILSSGFTGGGLNQPQGIAIDGAGTVWVVNFRGNSVTELAGAASPYPGQTLSPAAGWAPTPTSLQAFALAIDPSGNLWITNFAADSITELVGLATPVKTPLSALPKAP